MLSTGGDTMPLRKANPALAAAAAPFGAPTAVFRAPPTAYLHYTTKFDGSQSTTNPPGRALTYLWTFSDSGTATGVTADHTFNKVGNVTVTLVVSDHQVKSAPVSYTIPVQASASPKHP